jgi:hypothetical protein
VAQDIIEHCDEVRRMNAAEVLILVSGQETGCRCAGQPVHTNEKWFVGLNFARQHCLEDLAYLKKIS